MRTCLKGLYAMPTVNRYEYTIEKTAIQIRILLVAIFNLHKIIIDNIYTNHLAKA